MIPSDASLFNNQSSIIKKESHLSLLGKLHHCFPLKTFADTSEVSRLSFFLFFVYIIWEVDSNERWYQRQRWWLYSVLSFLSLSLSVCVCVICVQCGQSHKLFLSFEIRYTHAIQAYIHEAYMRRKKRQKKKERKKQTVAITTTSTIALMITIFFESLPSASFFVLYF